MLEYSANVPDEPDFDQVLRATAQSLLAVLERSFPRARAERRCDVTLEIREMQRDLYFKAALPPPSRGV